MLWWWWIIPTAVAVIGALILVAGLASLFKGRFLGGLFGTAVGGILLAGALCAALLGQNVQTYSRLSYERPVASLSVRRLAPQYFEATVTQPATTDLPARTAVYPINGDEWRMEAQVLKWKPWANVMGLDAQYRLDRISGRYQDIDQERTGARSVHALYSEEPGTVAGLQMPWSLSAWDVARKYRRYVDAVDTLYGSAAYMPMADGGTYEVWITQSGLIARPTNEAARAASAGGFVRVD
ncbi:hypothetical protein BZG35_06000 [Brevundimonas sp. LM2]|uniref:hypothetical protein n=1 Tax=Brevundimonas sp. LM2 TaxID=1938605 RepID=UPI000983F980|nr:hypothetical protein [Brevundimonas sp. LM2]AQR61249.1 hypothetical protein BZG35_06000 [Brevundimonas sp. LM2]